MATPRLLAPDARAGENDGKIVARSLRDALALICARGQAYSRPSAERDRIQPRPLGTPGT